MRIRHDKFDSLQIPRKPQPAFIEKLAVNALLCFQEIPALIYFSTLEKNRSKEILLLSFLHSTPPFIRPNLKEQTLNHFYWLVNCILKAVSSENSNNNNLIVSNFIPFELFLNDLQLLKSSNAQKFFKFFISFKNLTEKSKSIFNNKELIFIFLSFYKENRPLFDALKSDVLDFCRNNILSNGKEEELLYEQYLYEAFPLFSDETINNVDIVRIVNKKPVEIYSLPYSYSHLTFSKNYQILKTSLCIFPDIPSNFLINDINVSVINTSLISQKHFTDLIFKTSTTLFMSGNTEKALIASKTFPNFGNWVLATIVSKRLHDQNFINRVLPDIKQSIESNNNNNDNYINSNCNGIENTNSSNTSFNICLDFVNRISNDDLFFNYLRQITGLYIEPKKFLVESIPFIYRKILFDFNKEPFEQLCSTHLFLISDNDRIMDNDFICSFFILNYVFTFGVLNSDFPPSSHSSFHSKAVVRQIEDLFNIIKFNFMKISEKTKEKLVLDIFSLLFLRKNDRYIFSASLACSIISEITTFSSGELISLLKTSLNKLQMTRCITNRDKIEDALVPINSFVISALIHGDIDIAERVSSYDPKLNTLLYVFKNVDNYKKSHDTHSLFFNENQNNKDNDINNGNDLSFQEIALSFHDDQEIIDKAYSILSNNKIFSVNNIIDDNDNDKECGIGNENNRISEVKVLFDQRIKKIGKNLLKIVKGCRSEKVLHFKQLLVRLTSTEWEKIKATSENTPYFSSFINYLNTIIPVLFETNFAETVYDALSVSHFSIITQLLKNKNFELAEKIAKSFGTSIVDYVLSDASIDRSIIKEILDPYPIVTLTDKLTMLLETPLNDKANKVLTKYYKQQRQSNENENDNSNNNNNNNKDKGIEFYDGINKNGCDRSILIDQLKKLLVVSPIDTELLIDLSYRIPSGEFIMNVEKQFQKIDIKILANCSKFFGCDVILHDKLLVLNEIQQDLGISPFPLKISFSAILAKRKIKLAKNFLNFYRFEIDSVTLIRKEVLNALHQNSPVADLLTVLPKARNEIIDSLPIRFRSILEEESQQNQQNNSVDPLASLRSNINDHQYVVSFLSTHSSVDFDIDFQQMLLSKSINPRSSHISSIHSNVKKFYSVYRSYEKVLQPCVKQLFTYINLMGNTINDGVKEKILSKNIILIRDALNEINIVVQNETTQKHEQKQRHFAITLNEFYQNICCLCEFAQNFVFMRYGITYSFQNFSSKQIGEKLNQICYMIDLPELANKISIAYHIKDTESREKYAITLFQLGIYDNGLNYAPNRRRTTSSTSAKESETFSKKMIDLFSRSFIYETEIITYLSNIHDVNSFIWEFTEKGVPSEKNIDLKEKGNENTSKSPVSSTAKSQTGLIKPFTKPVSVPVRSGSRVQFSNIPEKPPAKELNLPISSQAKICDFTVPHFYRRILAISKMEIAFCPSLESNKMLRHFLRTNSKIGDQVSYFVSCGNFEKAFKYMSKLTTTQAKWTLFFDNIIFSAYSYGYEKRMQYRINDIDPSMETFGSYLEKLLAFSIKHNMPHLQLDLEMLLERSETAALTAIKLSTEAQSIKESMSFLDTAATALNMNLYGKGKLKNRVTNQISIEKLMQLKDDVDLQKKFCIVCCEMGMNECYTMNLFHGKLAIETMIIFLFKETKYNLALKILEHCCMSPASVAMKILDILVNESDEKIIMFVEGLSKVASREIYEQMLGAMLMRLGLVLGNQILVYTIISKCVNEPDFRCKLFIQFFQIEDAFKIAKNSNLISLLPLIGHIAQSMNLVVVVNDVNKILSRR